MCQRRGLTMRVPTRERGNATSATGQSSDRAALRRPSLVAIDTKGRQPQRPVPVVAPPPTVTVTRLNPDDCGTLAPQVSGAPPGWARDRSKICGDTDLEDSPWGSRLAARSTSQIEPRMRQTPTCVAVSCPRASPSSFTRSTAKVSAFGLARTSIP